MRAVRGSNLNDMWQSMAITCDHDDLLCSIVKLDQELALTRGLEMVGVRCFDSGCIECIVRARHTVLYFRNLCFSETHFLKT